MKIAFLQNDMRERFGFMYLSAMLKKAGHDVEVFVNELPSIKNFEMFGFSSSTLTFQEDLFVAKLIKFMHKESFIIFGGAHATFNPEDVIKYDCVDAVCVGEGFDSIVELASNHKLKDIKNLWFKEKRNEIKPKKDIDTLPMPDYDLYYKKYPELANKTTKQVYIVSGCPYKCAFCYNPSYNDLYKRQAVCQQMDIDKAIYEIQWLKEHYGFKYLQFISDNMSVNKSWLKRFLVEYKKQINVPYLLNVRANEVDEEIIKLLKDTGCNRVDFGIEHGNTYIRNNILNRNMSNEQIISTANLLNKYKIRFQTTNIFGLPLETLDKAIDSVKLNRKFKPEISKACILQPFENTQIYNYAKENNLLKDNLEYSGTTLQIGVNDNRANETKIKIDNEKQVVRLSYLFDFFVKQSWIPVWLIKLICYLPLNYKWYYKRIFKKQEEKYK